MPDNAEIAADLSINLMRQGKVDDAFALMEAWTESHSALADGWIALSRLYQIQGTHLAFGKASTSLTRALVADPNNLSALREMTELQMRMGNYANASTFADRFLSVRPDDAEIIFRKASLLARERSRLRDALGLVDKALALRTDNEYRSLRGYIYLALENYQEALQDFQVLAQSYTTTPAQIDLAIAESYLGIRDFNMGRRFYDLAVKKAGEGEVLDRERLSRVESKLQGV
jgi:tetratricopeptide (TPR) repeat protein